MTKVKPNNGNEAKADIFAWDTFKSGIIFLQSLNAKLFQ